MPFSDRHRDLFWLGTGQMGSSSHPSGEQGKKRWEEAGEAQPVFPRSMILGGGEYSEPQEGSHEEETGGFPKHLFHSLSLIHIKASCCVPGLAGEGQRCLEPISWAGEDVQRLLD